MTIDTTAQALSWDGPVDALFSGDRGGDDKRTFICGR
jgi:hypothetical protein